MLKAARAQGMPMMVIAMTTAATPQPIAIHTPPSSSHNRFSSSAIGVIALSPGRPRHDRHRRDGVLRRAFDQLVADGEIDQRVSPLVEHPIDVGALEEYGGARRIHFLPICERGQVDVDWADLSARNRKPRRVF